MKQNPTSQSGIFNLRVLFAFSLCSVSVLLAIMSFAAVPSSSISKGASDLTSSAKPATSTPLATAAPASWSIVPSGSGSATTYLTGVTCVSVSDCWAVGYSYDGNNAQTLTEHWDGTAWTIVSSPNIAAEDNFLQTVTCVSTSDCWAVGYFDNGSTGLQTLIEQWNGTAWAIVSSPNASGYDLLIGVTCTSASDCGCRLLL